MTAAVPALDLPATRALAQRIRRRVLGHTIANDGGYLSQACSSAELLATLYGRVCRFGPSVAPALPPPFVDVPGPKNPGATSGGLYNGPRAPELDRLFFSPVHYALVLYSVLIETGRMAEEALAQFNTDGSTVELIGAEHSPGIETMSGSLAQTLSVASGVAMGRRLKGEAGRTWVFMSDGELQEGQTWEALAALAAHKLDTVGVYVDVNAQQCDGPTDRVMNVEPLAARVAAFGAACFEVDGHDPGALEAPAVLARAGKLGGRPLVVLARTDPCRGIDAMRARAPRLHYVRFVDAAEKARFQRELDNFDVREG